VKKIRTIEETSSPGEHDLPKDLEPAQHEAPAAFRSLMTPQIMITLLNYGFTVFMESASQSIIPLLYASPISHGGLGLSSFNIGILMAISGMMIGLSSLLVLPFLLSRFGLTTVYRYGFAGHLVIQTTYSLMNVFARRSGHVDGFVIALLAVQVTFVNFTVLTFSE
jgi:hypothetical protein